jgi:cytoskeletal protein CcmA (bactofilin family)
MQTPSAVQIQNSLIGKSIVIKGEIAASVPLYVNGCVEGSISALGQRVTIGREGKVRADISAGEVVIAGDVRGNLDGCNLVAIRSDGSLTGDLATNRICIEDGAVVKGAIESHKPGEKNKAETHPAPQSQFDPQSEPQLELQEVSFTPESTDHREVWESLAVSEPV